MIHDDILTLIGNTPLVTVRRLNPNPAVTVAVKLEAKNPGGSIKDRVAMAMIGAAEQSGELTRDKTVIEATSGNTGIGLAMVCAVKGYRLRLLMPASASEERKRIMRAYGAQIVLTPGHLGTDGAIEEAYRLVREHPEEYVLMDQFNNPASIDAHYQGTGLEIWEQTEGRLTHLVVALGTSGTAMGCAKRLKEMNPAVRVVAVEPAPGHRIQGLKNMQESYPPGIYDKWAMDEILRVPDEEAFETARRLAREEGILAGMSGGAAMAGALRVAAGLTNGLVVTILPDGGERYLSTSLFATPEKIGVGLPRVAGGERVYLDPAAGPHGLFAMGPPLTMPGEVDAWRRIVFLDVLARYLERAGARVACAVGVADLEDKALSAAAAANLSRAEFTARAMAGLSEIASLLGVKIPFVAASSAQDRAVDLAGKLLRRGLAYEKLRSVYFDVTRDKGYGELLHADPTKLALGKTVDLAAYLKENPQDFTLLKRVSLKDLKRGDLMATPWGNVRPSWFLQMAVAALAGLPTITVVLAGEDQCFPHLENLRSIWSRAAGVTPLAWLVTGQAKAATASRTDDEPPTPDIHALLARGFSPRDIRLWLLSAAYRKSLSLAADTLAMWGKNRARVQETAMLLAEIADGDTSPAVVPTETQTAATGLFPALAAALEDDLGLYTFWPELFAFCRTVNTRRATLSPADASACLAALRQVDSILGLLDENALPIPRSQWPRSVAPLLQERETARRDKDFARADSLRRDIAAAGYRLEDTPSGPRLFR
ncbi:cysteine synthase [Desulfolutivibrio sulfoxidireducens]|uniref:cysteine synthase n=1 Tax=Desulfolutivibrio sulfoxidireducens TaxID=2773299 RepID=UPI00159E9962|nr:cysteine synthase [Desulfolutivibrio sulfoxidireducens]QLA17082.1 cysteine synthase [Desulfolutivibrio sulfoxidireducens]